MFRQTYRVHNNTSLSNNRGVKKVTCNVISVMLRSDHHRLDRRFYVTLSMVEKCQRSSVSSQALGALLLLMALPLLMLLKQENKGSSLD